MAQADYINSKKNYRMEFRYGSKSFKFSLNPEEYTMEEGTRSVVTQTKAGAWIDDFGSGLPKISIRGHTGVKSGGFKKFKALRNFIRSYHADGKINGDVKDELYFYNYTDEEYFVVHTEPSGFRLTRSASRPLLYQYEISLIVLRKASDKGITVNMKAKDYDYGASNSKINTSASSYAEQLETITYTKVGQSKNVTRAGSYGTSDDMIVQTGRTVVSSVVKSTSTAKSSGKKANGTGVNSSLYLQTFADSSDVEDQLHLYEFDPEISDLGISVLNDIKAGKIKDDSQASRLSEDSFPYLYHKFCKNKNVEKHLQERAKFITLEILAIAIYPDTFQLSMTENDLDRIIRNIHTMIQDLTLYNEYTLAQHFRTIQRCLVGLLGCNVFEENVATKLDQLNNAFNPNIGGD